MAHLSTIANGISVRLAARQGDGRFLRGARWLGIGALFAFGVGLALIDPCV